MDSLFTGSVQFWLAVAAATLSPLTALIVGFEGAVWFLRRRLGEVCDHAPLEWRSDATGAMQLRLGEAAYRRKF